MTTPVYLVDPRILSAGVPGATVRLEGPEGHHAVTVRRTQVGEALVLSDGAGSYLHGIVTGTDPAGADIRVDQVGRLEEPEPRFVLAQALIKGGRDEQAIEAATELGVDEVIPWQAERSVVAWRGDREAKARRKWESTLIAATKQSRRLRIPRLGETGTAKTLADRAATADLALVLHEEATEPLAELQLPDRGEVLLVVGPEGGIAPGELDTLRAAGGVPVRLGATVLRSGTAGPAALAVLASKGRWR